MMPCCSAAGFNAPLEFLTGFIQFFLPAVGRDGEVKTPPFLTGFSLSLKKAHIPFSFSDHFRKLIGEVDDTGMLGDNHSSIDDKI
jgi:hypothetical protein